MTAQSGWFTVGGTSVGAPSWAGLIAIADQGLALQRRRVARQRAGQPLSIVEHQLQPPDERLDADLRSASARTAWSTGLGSPKANLLVPALVQLNTPAATPATTSADRRRRRLRARSRAAWIVLPPSQTNPTSTGTASSSSTSSSSSSPTEHVDHAP